MECFICNVSLSWSALYAECPVAGSPRTKPVPGQAKRDRLMASMIGMHMGDAISAPLHWYYSYQVLCLGRLISESPHELGRS